LNSFSFDCEFAGLPLGLPARGTQMIQPTTENKYRFSMQVSARTMAAAIALHRTGRARIAG
jgi:hypothetical protein